MACNDTAWYQERITKAKAQVAATEDAIDFLLSNPTLSYSLDTGQGVQKVTRQDLENLQTQVDLLMSRIEGLQAKISGCGTLIARPSW